MPKRKHEVSFVEAMLKLKQAGIDSSLSPNREIDSLNELDSLSDRVMQIFDVINSPNRRIGNMLFFVMYDIESNKVRRHVAKYLLKMGCTRVQHSVFLADIDSKKYHQIRNDLAEVQAVYENEDSILICPVSTDLIKNMKVIGQNINIDLITHTKNTLFF